MRTLRWLGGLILLGACGATGAAENTHANYPGRTALIINNCPHVWLSGLAYENRHHNDRVTRFQSQMAWKNIASQSLVAFEVVLLKWDAFNQRLPFQRWTVTGTDSVHWEPLAPGESGSEVLIGSAVEKVFTVIAYVVAARLGDGTIWRAVPAEVLTEIQKGAPGLDIGSIMPDIVER